MLSGKVGMHTSPVYAEDVYIGAHSGVDRDGHRATFIVPVNAPGVTVVCRKVSARHANPFLAPLSSRFDELDGQLWLEEVAVPWDRVFLTEPSPDPIAAWCFWHQLYAWLAKAEFTLGLALADLDAAGVAVLTYAGLSVFDADGRALIAGWKAFAGQPNCSGAPTGSCMSAIGINCSYAMRIAGSTLRSLVPPDEESDANWRAASQFSGP